MLCEMSVEHGGKMNLGTHYIGKEPWEEEDFRSAVTSISVRRTYLIHLQWAEPIIEREGGVIVEIELGCKSMLHPNFVFPALSEL